MLKMILKMLGSRYMTIATGVGEMILVAGFEGSHLGKIISMSEVMPGYTVNGCE